MGATQEDDLFASRLGADNGFNRFGLDFARQQPLNTSLLALIRLSGQWSNNSLLASQEWQIGGADSVRGYAPGEAAGDYGYKASLELRVAPLNDKEILQLATFVDHGRAYRKQAVAGSKERAELTGVGVGVYSHMTFHVPIDLRLDIGWPVNPSKNFSDENLTVYFSASARF